jgi:hypothetical protein
MGKQSQQGKKVARSSQKEAALPAKGSNSTAGAKDKKEDNCQCKQVYQATRQQNRHCNAQTLQMLLGQLQENNLRLTWNDRQKCRVEMSS